MILTEQYTLLMVPIYLYTTGNNKLFTIERSRSVYEGEGVVKTETVLLSPSYIEFRGEKIVEWK